MRQGRHKQPGADVYHQNPPAGWIRSSSLNSVPSVGSIGLAPAVVVCQGGRQRGVFLEPLPLPAFVSSAEGCGWAGSGAAAQDAGDLCGGMPSLRDLLQRPAVEHVLVFEIVVLPARLAVGGAGATKPDSLRTDLRDRSSCDLSIGDERGLLPRAGSDEDLLGVNPRLSG